MARAAKEIQSKTRSIQRIRQEQKQEVEQLTAYGGVLAGNVGAAFVDSKYGDGEEPAETMGMPRNALIGLAGIAYGIMAPKRAPLKTAVGFTGAGFTGAALYRYAFDKLEEKEAEKAAQEAESA